MTLKLGSAIPIVFSVVWCLPDQHPNSLTAPPDEGHLKSSLQGIQSHFEGLCKSVRRIYLH